MVDLLSDLKKGKRGAIAKAITIVENDPKETKKLLKKIFKDSGNSSIIGITGPAGFGHVQIKTEIHDMDTPIPNTIYDPS